MIGSLSQSQYFMGYGMRAKMYVTSIEKFSGQEQLNLSAVTNGSDEDNTFSKFTPSASLKMSVTNPELIGKYEPGQKFYIDFTPTE